MLTNPGTPFTDEGFAAVVADIRRLYLLVGGGSNDLNNASTDVTQDSTNAGENANNAFKLRNVNLATNAPTDGQILAYSKARQRWEPTAASGVTSTASGSALIAGNNLSDVSNSATAATNLGLGSNSNVTHATLSTTSGLTVGGALSVSSGATITKDLDVSSGTRLRAGVRLNGQLYNVTAATIATSDCFVLTSGAIVLNLPSAATTSRLYAIACDVGAAAQIDAQVGQTIRGATGVTLVQGRIHWFLSDGGTAWYETRSA